MNPDAMIKLVEEIAKLLGIEVKNAAGKNKFGKHSWRSTAAQYFAELGFEILKIQLLARWESPVILQYAKLAPIKNAAREAIDLHCKSNLAAVIKDMQSSLVRLQARMNEYDDITARHLEE